MLISPHVQRCKYDPLKLSGRLAEWTADPADADHSLSGCTSLASKWICFLFFTVIAASRDEPVCPS